jgi:hypothetical protein
MVQDENGIQVGNSIVITDRWRPLPSDTRFACLRFVDPYGNTVFNRLQAECALSELNLLRTAFEDPERIREIDQLISLAQTAAGQPHLYLKFIGD